MVDYYHLMPIVVGKSPYETTRIRSYCARDSDRKCSQALASKKIACPSYLRLSKR